jgi:flagellar motor component MotA
MKVLRAIFNVLCFAGLVVIWAIASMFGADTISLKASLSCGILAVLVICVCALGNWIISDHHSNIKDMPKSGGNHIKGRNKQSR